MPDDYPVPQDSYHLVPRFGGTKEAVAFVQQFKANIASSAALKPVPPGVTVEDFHKQILDSLQDSLEMINYNTLKPKVDFEYPTNSLEDARAFNVTLQNPFQGLNKTIRVKEDQYILDAAEENGIILPFSSRSGVSTTEAARVLSGSVDNSEQIALSDCHLDRGFVLLDVAYPLSDCVILTHQEDYLDEEMLWNRKIYEKNIGIGTDFLILAKIAITIAGPIGTACGGLDKAFDNRFQMGETLYTVSSGFTGFQLPGIIWTQKAATLNFLSASQYPKDAIVTVSGKLEFVIYIEGIGLTVYSEPYVIQSFASASDF